MARSLQRFDPVLAQIYSAVLGQPRRMPMEWSAKPCQTDRLFGSWADDLAAAFVQLEPRKIASQIFQGAICRIDAGPIRISRVTATRHRVLRLRSHIARSSEDLCF